MAQASLPRNAEAQTVSLTDPRIKASYVEYDSPGGTSGRMRGCQVQPAATGPFPVVVVIHENRGLNPYLDDVAQRAAVAGFMALAPDGLFPVGGYPGNDDDGRTLRRRLDQARLKQDMLNSARFLQAHSNSTGRLGAGGVYCGGATSFLAVSTGADIHAAVPFYGAAPASADVARIKAPLLIHSAEDDERINATGPDLQAALEANGVSYQRHLYPGTRHGFHNNSPPRYIEAAAELAWRRTIEFYEQHLRRRRVARAAMGNRTRRIDPDTAAPSRGTAAPPASLRKFRAGRLSASRAGGASASAGGTKRR